MSENGQRPDINYWRRGLGTLLCLIPLELGMASIAWGMHYPRTAPFVLTIISNVLIALAVLISAFNFYLGLVRPLLFRHKPDYHYVSGVPILGSFLVLAGVLIGFGSIKQAMVGMVAEFLNFGGSVWFLIATWKDWSFWDV